MNYSELISNSYNKENEWSEQTKAEYISSAIFNFTTYDSSMDDLLVEKSIEVCKAISNGTTFDFIKDGQNYVWYCICVNFPFFKKRLNWGTSIRGAWLDEEQPPLESCELWDGDKQVTSLSFKSVEDFKQFIKAIVEFYSS